MRKKGPLPMAGAAFGRDILLGQSLGHYRIVERIGQGGMGVVYRAHDQHLERDVAVKILPAGAVAENRARKRFRKEALALSRLNHPNVETVFDFDTDREIDFLVTEYIPGIGLDEKIASGALPERDILRLGMQLAEGMAAAHRQNIVHRDLKPSNLRLVPDGRLKILDFGLAKLTEPSTSDGPTFSGSESLRFAGTLPYMAPEQVLGSALDSRADLWAAGAMLYEMSTGRRPFVAEGLQVTDHILHEAPTPPSSLNTRISPGLETAILKCLAKDPDLRFQSAEELATELRRLATPTITSVAPTGEQKPKSRRRKVWFIAALATLAVVCSAALAFRYLIAKRLPHIRSVAVLPLENLSGDPQQEFFVDGMHEELIATLGKVGSLKVISRTSVMQYRATQKPLPTIAKELKVDAVIEGSVRRANDQVRVTVELFEGKTERSVWSNNYQSALRDTLALQSSVARAIAQEVRAAITAEQQASLASARPVDPAAHDAYLRGRYYWNKRTAQDLQKALEYFQQALAIDPNYALAYSGVADCQYIVAARGFFPPERAYRDALRAANRAVELDELLAEAHTSLGMVKSSQHDWIGAEKEFLRAIALNPSYATARHWYSVYLTGMGRQSEAQAQIAQAQELDPFSLIISEAAVWPVYVARQYPEAIRRYEAILATDPSFVPAYYDLGRAYLYNNQPAEAIRVHSKLVELTDGNATARAELAHTYALSGHPDKARKMLRALIDSSMREYVSPVDLAKIYAALNEKATALDYLEKAVAASSLLDFQVDPDLDPLRSEPRFRELQRRLNFPPPTV